MSSAATPELSAGTLIDRIEAGEYPREVLLTVARGFLPLPQEDLIAVLAYLCASADEEVSTLAKMSLSEVPGKAVADLAANDAVPPRYLELLLRAASDNTVVEALIRNRAVSDAAVEELARTAEPAIQDVIVINHARILRAPTILDALLANPHLSPDARRRALETREEFFDKKARAAPVVPDSDEDDGPLVNEAIPLDDIADLLARADATTEPSSVTINESELKEEKKASVWAQIQKMTVAQKVMLAFRGDKTVRSILVRDRNKLVCSAVMRNPRMTPAEAEAIAGMRNVDDEVIRLITLKREWMQKYTILNTLCHNPKTPVGVVMPLINRLTLRDLKGLKDDKNVPEVVRQQARKFYVARTQKS